MAQLWQGETEKAIENFPISGERVPVEVVRMLARVKAEAARMARSSKRNSNPGSE